jgi:hypothetical protein
LLGLILKSIQTASIIVFSIATLQKANIAFQNFDTDFASLPSTLGNPNFMSAFMAIAAFSWLPSLNQKRTKSSKFLANRLYSLMGVVGCLYGVYLADSFQGYVILIAGVMGLIFFFLYTRKRKKTLTFLCGLSTLLAIPVLAGLANKGPLASLIYQETIAFRFYYWKVAIRAVINSPLFGYGFDTYEYVFRLFRSREEYLRLPGVVSDSSHNIFLDLAIFGGVPLSLLWLTLSLIALKNICNLLRKFGNNTNGDNFIIVSGVMTFFGLQLQSLINPFQFGISIWLLLITIFFCVQSLGPELKDSKHRRKNSEILINGIKGKKRVFVSSFMVVLTIVINPLFCALPLVTDIRFRNAVQSSSPNRLLAVALSWPIVPSRTQSIADGLVNSTLNNGGFAPGTIDDSILRLQKQLGIDLGEKLTLLSPNSFVAWEFVYKNEENVFKKKAALIQLRRLDPSNTEWEKDN